MTLRIRSLPRRTGSTVAARPAIFLLWSVVAGCATAPSNATGAEGDAGAERDAERAAAHDGSRAPDDVPIVPEDASLACTPEPRCDAPLPELEPRSAWRNSIASSITTAMGAARHRGRDLYLRESDPQWALAKFAYGPFDDDLKGEDVDVYLLRDCGTQWELLGTETTSDEGDHETVEGVEDDGGRVYFSIDPSARLGIGRHRLVFVVRGDHSIAEQFIEVLPSTSRFVVTDVDGTQTESETADWVTLFGGPPPASQPSGPELLGEYRDRGYRIFYLTARPEWLHAHTHEWLALRGYPAGNVQTTLSGTGALGAAAEDFKTDALATLLGRFPNAIEVALGNTDTDAGAYAASGIDPEDAYLLGFDPGTQGTRIDDYATLLPRAEAAPYSCSL
jgi:hypothetical protein